MYSYVKIKDGKAERSGKFQVGSGVLAWPGGLMIVDLTATM